MMDVEIVSSLVEEDRKTGTAAHPSPPVFVLTEPQPSILTAPLIAHFTAQSSHSTLEHLHSVQRLPAATRTAQPAQPVPLYRKSSLPAPHKRQKRHQHPPTDTSSSSSVPPPPQPQQPTVEHLLAFHTASSISLPLLSFVVSQLRTPVLVALVDSGQSVTVLRVQAGIVPHPRHGQQKKSSVTAAVAKAGTSRTTAASSSAVT